LSYEPNRVTLSVKAPVSGYVFLADNDFPGWKASVNGAPAHIHRADLAFRAVRVPAGPSKIVFSYAPLALEFGTAATALGLAAWLILFLWHGPSLKGSPHDDPAAALNFWTARALRGMILGLMIPAMAFWGLWGLFVFGGGIQDGFKRPAPLFSMPFGSTQNVGGARQAR
ncbi:MAG: YfhO family protein, partial [Elusimicrobia bacterium]|nr:YfhO family protein [Elusimicrobiota bacterium]